MYNISANLECYCTLTRYSYVVCLLSECLYFGKF